MMRYSKEIVNQIKIIDEVLYSLNLPSILKNEYFVTDAISCENYLKLHYNKNFKEFVKILFTSFIRIKKIR